MFYMKDANINVRIEKSIYTKAKELGVDFSEVVRSAVIREIERRRVSRIREALGGASKAVKKMSRKSIVKEVRKARETR